MSYSVCFRPGMEDLNPDLTVKNRCLLRLCEDTAGFHSDAVGDGLLHMGETNYAWILLAWNLRVLKRPRYGSPLTVITHPREIARVHAWRDFEIRDDAGDLAAEATSKWIVIQADTHSVIRVPEIMHTLYPEEPGNSLSGWRPGRLSEPEQPLAAAEAVIRPTDTDMLGHLHNLCYLDLAENMLPDQVPGAFDHVTIVYKNEVRAGQQVRCLLAQEEEGHSVTITGPAGICSQVHFW